MLPCLRLSTHHTCLAPYFQLSLGLAEFRSGHFAEAERAPINAESTGRGKGHVQGAARLFRAMILVQQSRLDEARDLIAKAQAVEATMTTSFSGSLTRRQRRSSPRPRNHPTKHTTHEFSFGHGAAREHRRG
jgi:hypothetical protein